jgi:hypothetical protein
MVAAPVPPPPHRPLQWRRRAGTAAAVLLLGFVLWPYWHLNFVTARLLLAAPTAGSSDLVLEQFYPGLPGAVRLLATTEARIWSLPREQAPLLQQRLVEMLYPRPLRPYDLASLRAGDLVAVDTGRDLPVPADEVYAAGLVRILRVRP